MWIVATLLLIGLILVLVEILFIPGTTVVGIVGCVLMLLGVIFSYREFGSAGNYVLLGSLLVLGFILFVSFKFNLWDRFALKEQIEARFNEDILKHFNVGDEGKTISALRPSGKAIFHEKEIEVHTLGRYCETGTKVKIIQIQSSKIIVEPTS